MLLRAVLLLSLTLSVAACGDNRLNPFNWFGNDREQRVRVDPDAAAGTPSDPRSLVSEITQLSVEQTTSGAILRATGVTPVQGYFDAELVLAEINNGAIVFEFRAAPPVGQPTPGLQTIVAGVDLTNGELAGIRSITVIGANNRRSVSRR
ncbi:hypothetical protein [Gymnodinialimonas hymeniacidonis]|uniref:hypothetical protein n=1 Tax=Gymnodinialimonas hymeniacidonis TaxID=3126508 RepID=UPI0034C67106